MGGINDIKKKEYSDWYSSLASSYNYSNQQVDQNIVYIGSGGVTLLLGFSQNLGKLCELALILYWIGVVVISFSVAINLFSQLLCSYFTRKAIEELNSFIKRNYAEPLIDIEKQKDDISGPILKMNLCAVLLLILGFFIEIVSFILM